MVALTTLEEFKLKLIIEFITSNPKDEVSDKLRNTLLINALKFVTKENSGFPLLVGEEVEDLKVLYNHVDEDSNLAKTMLKVLTFAQDLPTKG